MSNPGKVLKYIMEQHSCKQLGKNATIIWSQSRFIKINIRSDSHCLDKGYVVDVMYFYLSKVFHKVQATFIKALCSLCAR